MSLSLLLAASPAKADQYDLSTYVNTTVGNTISEAAVANPSAQIILNGTLFNYEIKKGKVPVHSEKLISLGLVINNGTVQPTSCAVVQPATLGCKNLANSRWWFGQQFDGLYVHGGRVKSGQDVLTSGHPPVPGTPPGETDLKAAIGGLYIYITNRSTYAGQIAHRHIVTPAEDHDLRNLYGFVGSYYGYGGIAYDVETNLLLVFSKKNVHLYSVKFFVSLLYDSGADWVVGTDGGSSTALGIKEGAVFDYPVRSGRHDDSDRPDISRTVTNYFVFTPK